MIRDNFERLIIGLILIIVGILGLFLVLRVSAKETTMTATVETSPYYECVARCEVDYLINK